MTVFTFCWSVLSIVINIAITDFYYLLVHCLVCPVDSSPPPPVVEPLSPFPGLLPLDSAVTPLHVDQFALELENYPNQLQVSFVLEGLSKRFRVGYNYPRKLKSASRNRPSAYAHPDVVDAYLEVSLWRVAGPFDSPPLPDLHISSFGVTPKKGRPGKWRLIVDLSSHSGQALMMKSLQMN